MMEKTANNKGSKWKVSGAKRIKALYKHYKETEDNPLKYDDYRKILYRCNELFMEDVLEGKMMRFPYLSTVFVRKIKIKASTGIVNWKKSKELGHKITHNNEHSDGFSVRIHWAKKRCPIVGKATYSFKPTRANSRALAKEMNKENGHSKYIEISKYGR